MRKIFLTIFLFLILFFTIITIYFSTIGIKTSKFNQLINDKLTTIEPRLNAKLEEVILILDLQKREIKLKTDNTNLYLDDTSSNGIRGILTGDYAVKKQSRGVATIRDSVMKTPKISHEDDGAI